MESDCGGSLSGAIVLGHEHGGAYAIRPYTDVRQWPLSFIRPQNVFQLRRMPVGRYCSLPGIWGAYAFAPLHGRPTMADVVHSPPKCSSIAADACRALLFPAGKIGGVCNTPLHGRPTMAPDARSPPSETILWADDTHSPLKCFPTGAADTRVPFSECPIGAADARALLLECPIGAAGTRALLSECPMGAADAQTPSKWFPTGRLFAQTPSKWFPTRCLFAQTPQMDTPTGRLFAQTPHLCIFLTASGAWWLPVDRARTARTAPRPAMGKRK